MDTRKIRKLIELVNETGIGELEIKSGEEWVRICQKGQMVATVPASLVTEAQQPQFVSQASKNLTAPEEKPVSDGHQVLSPMVGTFYLAPASGSMPFVAVGDHVKVGDTLCLIEAMKMFNKIEADISGVLSARLIENEQPVEYGQPLFLIELRE